jgi:hypothetical protein
VLSSIDLKPLKRNIKIQTTTKNGSIYFYCEEETAQGSINERMWGSQLERQYILIDTRRLPREIYAKGVLDGITWVGSVLIRQWDDTCPCRQFIADCITCGLLGTAKRFLMDGLFGWMPTTSEGQTQTD